MADDHNALLARAALIVADGKPGWPTVRDLAAELRALTSRHHTALNIIARLVPPVLKEDHLREKYRVEMWDTFINGGWDWTEEQRAVLADVRAVLDQAKDLDHE
jgi:hypothetical protein